MPDETRAVVMALRSGKAAGMWLHGTASSLITYPSLTARLGPAPQKWQRGEETWKKPLHVCLSYGTAATCAHPASRLPQHRGI